MVQNSYTKTVATYLLWIVKYNTDEMLELEKMELEGVSFSFSFSANWSYG